MARLTASDGTAGDYFGRSVSISGDQAIVGAYLHDTGGNSNQGKAYVFTMPGGGWSGDLTEDARLTASDGEVSDLFGYSVSISGDHVIVGAHRHNSGGNSDQGKAYLFTMPGGGWSGDLTEYARLTASDGAEGDYFGHSTINIQAPIPSAQLLITDLTGRTLHQAPWTPGHPIDVQHLPPGTYFLSLQNDQKTFTGKLVKQ